MSAIDPPVQTIPQDARRLFLPDEPGWKLAAADLRQAEVIGLLWFAEEWALIDRIKQGEDIHQIVADMIGCERKFAKTTTFALLYGEAPKTTGARLHMAEHEILDIRRQYFDVLPGVQDYRTRTIRQAMMKGEVESPFGVKRYLRVDSEFGNAANKAANAPIQNIPAMVGRYAMIDLARQLPTPARVWNNVYDEVVITYPEELETECLTALRDIMGQAWPQLPTPKGPLSFPIDVHTGYHWGECK